MKGTKKQFSREAFKSLRQTGAITATSKYSVEKMLSVIDFNKDLTIVEFGVGNGVVTTKLLNRISPGSRLVALEINENLYNLVSTILPSDDDRISFHKYSAFDIDNLLDDLGIGEVDYFISTLPLTMFSKEDNIKLMTKMRHYLKPSGKYVQIQYSPLKYPMVRRYFPKVKVSLVLANIPPAIVYFCSL
ncbi:MAG TPA: methyltransferase domain-containing protein [Saprospiraceae bacterium]|nr:methyltransferase domain-containing protein [Saprospiraceae bacterium]